MLQSEIAPFGEGLSTVNLEIQDKLLPMLKTNKDTFTFTREEVQRLYDIAGASRRGFDRFTACALDEWKQKEQYRKFALEHGYPYS